jgi:hypothetical protein
MKHKILFSFVFLLYGCISQTASTETPLTVVTTPLKTLESPALSTPSSVQTPSLETSFSVTEICPLDRFVLDKYLEFSSNASLLTLIDSKLALINLRTGIRKIYDQIVADSNTLFTSPDGKHISFLSTDGENKKLWVFTPSVEESPKSFLISKDTVWLSWIANDKIALWNYPDSNGCQQYDGFFDLKTEDITQPKNRIPELDQTKCRLLPSISDDGLKAFYPWQIRDLSTGTTFDVHIIDNISTDPPHYVSDWSDDSISIMSFKENILSYALDLPRSSLDNQPIKLQNVQMPAFATKSHYWTLPITASNLKKFGWDLIDRDTDVSGYYADPSKGNLPTNFYTIALDTSQFVNYCLDRSIPHNQEKINFAKPVHQGYFSPDGKYLAWTIYSTADYTPPIETQVLDLETGKVIVFEDIEAFGWVIP